MEDVILEVIPPAANWNKEKVVRYCHNVTSLLRSQNILSVCIPEVVDESREGDRTTAFEAKIDNVEFASLLRQQYHDIVPIIFKICVRQAKPDFAEWLEKIYEKGIRHVVLVGGERHDLEYSGYSVLEATHFIKTHYPKIKIGGIIIFTRSDEATHIIEKMKAGIDFFCSQIIFEAANMKQILTNLSRLCEHQSLCMPKIYLSLALASKVKDIDFMKWLGVEFPTAIYSYLTEKPGDNVETHSIEVMNMILDEIFYFIDKKKMDLGFNIEHVMYTNLLLSQKLFKIVRQRIAQE